MSLIPLFFPDCVVAIGSPTGDDKTDWIASGFLLGKFLKKIDELHSNTFAKIPNDFFDRHICGLAYAATARYGAKIFPFENWRWY